MNCAKSAPRHGDAAKAFLDTKRGNDGLLSAEDTAVYEKMEADVVALGKEVERLERQSAIDLELSRATSNPITNVPSQGTEEKTGRASAEYRKAFWNAMRTRAGEGLDVNVRNALQIGTDTEGGYLVPDEFERTLVEALEDENIFRTLANVITTSSGDRKIPVVASKVPRAGSTRKEPFPRATMPSVRCPSAPISWEP